MPLYRSFISCFLQSLQSLLHPAYSARRHFRHFNRSVYLLIYLPRHYSDVSTLTVLLESFFHYLNPRDSDVASPQVATVQKHPETYLAKFHCVS